MPVPQYFTKPQRFLRIVNHLSKSILNLAEDTAPLRALLRNPLLICKKTQLDAIKMLKTLITSAPILKIINPNQQD